MASAIMRSLGVCGVGALVAFPVQDARIRYHAAFVDEQHISGGRCTMSSYLAPTDSKNELFSFFTTAFPS